MADVSRNPREHWLKPLFSKNEVAKSGYTLISHNPATRTPPLGSDPRSLHATRVNRGAGYEDWCRAERLARRRRLSYFFTTTLPNDANPYNPRPLRPVSPHRPPPTSDKVDSAKNCLDESPDLTNNIQERVRTDIKTILSQERIPLRQFNLVFGK